MLFHAHSDPSGRTGDKRHRRRLLRPVAVTAILALSLGTVACADKTAASTDSQKKVTLSIFWWGATERADITAKVLDLYTRRHPNVTFKQQWQKNAGYYDALSAMIAKGEGPDMFQIDDNTFTEYADRNILLDLSKFAKTGRINEKRFPESLVEYGKVHGKQYGIAAGANTPGMAYDKTAIKSLGLAEPQIGWSYDEFITWAADATAKSGGTTAGTMDPSSDYKALWLWLRAQGKELYDGAKLGFTPADAQRWFELWAGARARHATPSVNTIVAANNADNGTQPLLAKLALTAFGWSNTLAEMQRGTDHELGLTAYPGDPKSQWSRASMYWSIFKGSTHADAVADVINFFVNDSEAGKLIGTERGLPPNRDIRSQLFPSLPPAMQTTMKFEDAMAAKFGPAPAPPPKGHIQIRTLLIQAAESVQTGKATAEQAAAQFCNQAQQTLMR